MVISDEDMELDKISFDDPKDPDANKDNNKDNNEDED